MGFTKEDLTQDRFLNGKVLAHQPRRGYRAGADPVFLAAAVNASPGQSVLELGCGAGVASLCLGRRVAGLRLTGVEIQPEYADLARLNARENGIDMDVVTADICALPDDLRARSFDHVIANPPYYERGHGTKSDDAGRDMALAGDTPLAVWVDTATRRLKPGGVLTFIQKADRLPDLLAAIDGRLGGILVKPLAPRIGRASELVLLVARKGGRAKFRLLAPLILHEGAAHERDGDSYTEGAKNILRSGGALEIS